jgi:hypothetical protein
MTKNLAGMQGVRIARINQKDWISYSKRMFLNFVDKTVEVVPGISVQVVPGISVEVVPLFSSI